MSIRMSVCLFLIALGLPVHANDRDRKTMFTFPASIEVPGHVLPAGTYTFKVADAAGDRVFVNVFGPDPRRMVAAFPTLSDTRAAAASETILTFRSVPSGAPGAIQTWFYPGDTVGLQFVYSRRREAELVEVAKVVAQAVTPGGIVAVTVD